MRGVAAPEAPAHGAHPIGIVAPEWALERSARGAALWRHAGAMNASARESVEVLALDRVGRGRPLSYRDQWNVPASGSKFRVRRVLAGGRTFAFNDIDRARLEGLVLDWVRERKPRLVHVLELDAFGPGLLLALEAAGVPVILTMERLDELRAALALHAPQKPVPVMDPKTGLVTMGQGSASDSNEAVPRLPADSAYAEALRSVRRVVVRCAEDAATAESSGAPRERIRVMAQGENSEVAVLRAYASLYRLLATPA